MLENGAVKQSSDVSRKSVRSHDEGGIQNVNIFAGDSALRVTHQRRDGDFGKSEVVADAGETVTQNVRCDAFEG